VAAALAAEGARDVVVDAAEPTLEDVFLAVVGAGGGAGEAGP
jgi:ABC-2 type transport system ATP-binding protein